MNTSAKSCIMGWWVGFLIALILWYRNYLYDRLIAAVIFVLALIQLIDYGCHSYVDAQTSGNVIAVLLVVVVFVLGIGTYLYTNNSLALLVVLVLLPFLFLVVVEVFCGDNNYKAYVPSPESSTVWMYNNEPILGSWSYIFFVAVFICWLVLLNQTHWQNIGLYVVGLYVVLSLLFVSIIGNDYTMGSQWCYLLIGIGIIVYLIGMFHTPHQNME